MKINKIVLSGMLVCSAFSPMSAFALNVNSNEASVPVNATIAATPIDVTVSDAITATALTNSNDLTFTNLELTNNSTAGVIGVSKMAVNPTAGWKKVADSTDFSKLAMNAKTFSMIYDTHDLATDYSTKETIDPTKKKTYTFTGQTGGVTTAVDAQNIANVVLTLAYE